MKKYLVLFLPLFAAACANTVEVEEDVEYKCGDQIIKTEMLGDDSMIANINGINNVLVRTASDSGRRYENNATRVVFTQKDGETSLSIKGRNYPLCREIVR